MSLLHSLMPLLLVIAGQSAGEHRTDTGEAKKLPSHPAEVALVDEGEKGSVYRRFPSGERLYTYDRDPPGGSVCNAGCAMAWPPVLAPANGEATGEWTIVRRADGKRQWALKGKPVYTRFHDSPEKPAGNSLDAAWHMIPHTAAPSNPTPAN